MRRRIALRQVRAILAVDRGKDRVPASGNAPPFADRFQRKAHAVGGLMAADAGAPVGTYRLEERMARGVEQPVGIQHAEPAIGVFVLEPLGDLAPVARRPPLAVHGRWT